jgi:hypothetical protein
MGLTRLRRTCRALLATVDIPRPFDIQLFCRYVAERRGRDLHVYPLPEYAGAGVPCGLWLATDHADHIFHVRGSSPMHERHIILHEIGHLLCDHAMSGEAADDALAALLPDLDPQVARRVLRRSSYSAPQEQVAEMMASIILEQADSAATGYAGTDDALGKLQDALGKPHRSHGG